jgi:hypothetical protein
MSFEAALEKLKEEVQLLITNKMRLKWWVFTGFKRIDTLVVINQVI